MQEQHNISRGHKLWREWRGLIVFIVVMLLFRSAVADWNHVPTGSMLPTIVEGDRIVVDKLAYDVRVPFTHIRLARHTEPQRSDIVTFESPKDATLLVKRIVGVPGDIVELRKNKLWVNGEAARYEPLAATTAPQRLQHELPYLDLASERVLGATRPVITAKHTHASVRDSFGPIEVPNNHFLLLGDNRDNSRDFRYFDFVHRDLILGRAESIAFSLDFENYYVPRTDRFFLDLQ